GNFLTSSAAQTQTVTNVTTSTSTTVTSSVNPSVFGQSVTFTATVTPNGATGTVTFFDGSTSIGQGPLNTTGGVTSATFSTSSLAVATHTVTGTYNGSSNFNGSNGTLSGGQVVTKANTSTALASSANPSVAGQSVTFTATV